MNNTENKLTENEKKKEEYEKRTRGYKRVPKGALILGENAYYSRNCYETQLNNNVCIVGTSGSGKTRGVVEPNIMQAEGSYVISDPKGTLVKDLGPYLEERGYTVLVLDFIHPELSAHYNPILRCRSTSDIHKLANTLVYELNHKKAGGSYDPFWDETTTILLDAVIGYLLESDEIPIQEKTLLTVSRLISESVRRTSSKACLLDIKMEKHEQHMKSRGLESWAVRRYKEYNTAPDKTHDTINICTLAKMVGFDTIEVRKMLSGNDIEFTQIGTQPTALFIKVSDTDRSKDVLVNLLYSQLMNELCDFADSCEGGHLPIPVQFILDDFATNARINNFENIISNIRSRWISTMIMIQSEAQLVAGYGDDSQTIIDNCNTYVYMGGSSPEQAERVAKRANKTVNTILNMPVSMSWIFRRGQKPLLCRNFDLEWFRTLKDLMGTWFDELDQDIHGSI